MVFIGFVYDGFIWHEIVLYFGFACFGELRGELYVSVSFGDVLLVSGLPFSGKTVEYGSSASVVGPIETEGTS